MRKWRLSLVGNQWRSLPDTERMMSLDKFIKQTGLFAVTVCAIEKKEC
jgi:hypothetical protein